MPNKHFCQGPTCHTRTTNDRFLKSRGVLRGKYAYATLDQAPNQWGWTPSGSVLGAMAMTRSICLLAKSL